MALAWSWGSRRSLASSIPRRSVSPRRPGAERPHDLEGEARVDLRRSCRGADRRRARITPRRRRPRAPSGGTDRAVVLSIRLPRIAAAVLAGGALAVAGAGFQALTRNPLAEPSILGVSGGAAFGVVVAQVSGLGQGVVDALGLAAFGFAGAVVAGLAVYLIASSGAGLPVHTLLLAGVIVGIFFSASITVLISIVDANRLGGVIYWLLGSVAPIPPGQLVIFTLATAVGVWLVLGQARALNLLALGEEGAT